MKINVKNKGPNKINCIRNDNYLMLSFSSICGNLWLRSNIIVGDLVEDTILGVYFTSGKSKLDKDFCK